MYKRSYKWLLVLASCLLLNTGAALAADEQEGAIPTVDPQAIKSLVKDHKGKVVLVNFWATWCPPCVKEFPDIIKLYDQYKSKGLEVIAVSMNEEDEMDDIKAFIKKYNPPFSIYRASSDEEDFYTQFDKRWFGQMPTTAIYDASGKMAHLHMKPLSYPEFQKDVVAALPQ